ncbi:MAG: hypothetical protein V1733_07755 [bacterium]
MKNLILFITLLFLGFTVLTVNAQVAINTTGNPPDNSAMLDVVSTTKGALIPRMTTTQRDAISSPATGLMVYVTTNNKYYYYNGSAWIMVVGGADDDWTITGTDMYTAVAGCVGIGAYASDTKFYVYGIFPSTSTIEDVVTIHRGSTGTPAAGIGAGIKFYNKISGESAMLSGRMASIMETVGSTSSSGMLFQTKPLSGTLQDALYLDPDGNVGVGTRDPGTRMEITGSAPVLTLNANTSTSPGLVFEENGSSMWNINANYSTDRLNFSSGSHANLISFDQDGGIDHNYLGISNGFYSTGTTSAALFYIQNSYAGDSWGLSAGMSSSSAGSTSYGVLGFNYGLGYGVYGRTYNSGGIGLYGKNNSSSNFGYAGSGSYGLYGENGIGNYGYIGSVSVGLYGRNSNGNYGYIGGSTSGIYGGLESTDVTNYAIYGFGVHANLVNGTGYGIDYTLGAVKGYNYFGNPYTFGVAGYSYLDYNRSGGCFGAKHDASVWGCMGYKNSGGIEYGGYFTSYTSGSGKGPGTSIDIGIGAWGDLFGADIHGNIYGLYSEGANYALYAHGDVYRDGLDIHLQTGGNNESTPLYTMVSPDAIIQTCGYATLNQGSCAVAFDAAFSNAVSQSEPVVVTITPHGNCNGVYLSGVNSHGFTVVENNAGKSNVMISYIAMGKRAGYENPVLPEEVIASDYTEKLKRGLHNDGDMQTSGEGLYYENGNLTVGIHSSTLPDPNKPPSAEEPALAPEKPDHQKPPRRVTDDDNNGRAIPEKTK